MGRKKLTHDDYYNMMLLAENLSGFIHDIRIFPDFSCFLGVLNVLII